MSSPDNGTALKTDSDKDLNGMLWAGANKKEDTGAVVFKLAEAPGIGFDCLPQSNTQCAGSEGMVPDHLKLYNEDCSIDTWVG
jgi:hypothetical protein